MAIASSTGPFYTCLPLGGAGEAGERWLHLRGDSAGGGLGAGVGRVQYSVGMAAGEVDPQTRRGGGEEE